MTIYKVLNDENLIISLNGKLDANTAPNLEKEVSPFINENKSLIFDFEKLDYISSSGLRVLLNCKKKMNTQSNIIIQNANDYIKEVFDITGFNNLFTIE